MKKSDHFLNKKELQKLGDYDSTFGIGRSYVPNPRMDKIIDGVTWHLGTPRKPVGVGESELMYNEFIVYDENQVNIKYLVVVEFHFRVTTIDLE